MVIKFLTIKIKFVLIYWVCVQQNMYKARSNSMLI
uniref:Uncharacterized protein n=1 Tax=Anguilla anguilla TaxID=7936 RepID=A0A0E9Q7J0_ANGAN